MLAQITQRRVFAYFVIMIFVLSALVSKFFFNGLVYGLDFGLYHPDGTLYTFRTLKWIGVSDLDAGTQISNWYAFNAEKMKAIAPDDLFFSNNANWQFYKSRLLYSALSIPFVKIFGISGMLIIPAISMFVAMLVVYEISRFYSCQTLGLIAVFIFSSSLTVIRWMFVNTTDSLFVALTCLLTLLLLKWQNSSIWLSTALLISGLMSITRVALFVLVPFCVILFFKSRLQALIIVVFAFICSLPFVVQNPSLTLSSNLRTGSVLEKSFGFITNFIRVLTYEFAQLLVLDRFFLGVLSIGILLSIYHYKLVSSQFFLLLLISLLVMGGLNGTIGVNFRFQLPVIGALAWTIMSSYKFQRDRGLKF